MSAFLALLIAGVTSTPFWYSSSQSCAAGTCTTAAPSSGVAPIPGTGPGKSMLSACGYHLQVCAASGQTLSGAGTIDVYWWSYNPATVDWAYSPLLQEVVNVGGKRCLVFPSHNVPDNGEGVLYPVANGVTVSGGSSITITMDGSICSRG